MLILCTINRLEAYRLRIRLRSKFSQPFSACFILFDKLHWSCLHKNWKKKKIRDLKRTCTALSVVVEMCGCARSDPFSLTFRDVSCMLNAECVKLNA